MARILRGDICWADLDPVRGHEQGGQRPVLVISEEVFNTPSNTVIAMAITSKPTRVGFPLMLELTSVKMPQKSWVKIGQIRTLALQRLGRKIGRVSSEELQRILEGLNQILGNEQTG